MSNNDANSRVNTLTQVNARGEPHWARLQRNTVLDEPTRSALFATDTAENTQAGREF